MLETDTVLLARAEEIVEFKKHGWYVKVRLQGCDDIPGKLPLAIRWIDINRGDEEYEAYGSRLVAILRGWL